MTETPIAIVRRTIESWFPDASVRVAILSALASSIRAAHRFAPSAWGVSHLRDAGIIRLNVGGVEVLVLSRSRGEHLFAVQKADVPRRERGRLTDIRYKSIPNSAFIAAPSASFADLYEALTPQHLLSIAEAGKDRQGYRWKESHAVSLIAYLRDELGEIVPQPSYVSPISGPPTVVEQVLDPSEFEEISPTTRPELRRQVLNAYGGRCAITGNSVESVLDIALVDSSGGQRVSNSIPLRLDLLSLFLRGLIRIEPNSLRLVMDPSLDDSDYAYLEGRELRKPRGDAFLDTLALKKRWES